MIFRSKRLLTSLRSLSKRSTLGKSTSLSPSRNISAPIGPDWPRISMGISIGPGLAWVYPFDSPIDGFTFQPWMKKRAARFQPLGILSLAGYLSAKNPEIKIVIMDMRVELALYFRNHLDNQQDNNQQVHDRISKDFLLHYIPGVVGISCIFHSVKDAVHQITALVKDILSGSKVVLGGSYPSTSPELALQDKNIDFIVEGKGNSVLKNLSRFSTGQFQHLS